MAVRRLACAVCLGCACPAWALSRAAVRALTISASAAESSAPAACSGFGCVEEYIDRPDAAYGWRELPEQAISGTCEGVNWTGRVLSMVSQRWLSANDTDHQVWTHPLVVITPGNLAQAADWVTLVIGGAGSRTEDFSSGVPVSNADVQAAVLLAVRTGALAAALLQVPNQPMAFSADPAHKDRVEDAIKAFTWHHAEEHPDALEWPIEFPNAKAAVRAMDALAAFTRAASVGSGASRFGVTGCSKRAVAAIMACAHDRRCELLMPCAITAGFKGFEHLSYKSLGAHPFVALDYVANNVVDEVDTPELEALQNMVDPLSTFDRLTMPKLWLNSVADDFFTPDHTTLWWDRLPGPKYLYQKENAHHAAWLTDENFLGPAAAFVGAVLGGGGVGGGAAAPAPSLPSISWQVDPRTGEIVVQQLTDHVPASVTLWSAQSCVASARRDFRAVTLDRGPLCAACGSAAGLFCAVNATRWRERGRPAAEGRTWRAAVPAPAAGWEAFYLTFDYPAQRSGGGHLQLSTEVSIVPVGKFPFKECEHPKDCRRLVLADTGSKLPQ